MPKLKKERDWKVFKYDYKAYPPADTSLINSANSQIYIKIRR